MTTIRDSKRLELPHLDELIILRDAAELSGVSAGHLRLLVSQGDIWGDKLGRDRVSVLHLLQDRR
jgi:hypothetical protein